MYYLPMTSEQLPERTLWARVIEAKLGDAIHPFVVPDNKNTLQVQYAKLLKRARKNPKLTYGANRDRNQAIYFFETSHFDCIADDIGYGSLFVNKTCALIQECLTLRKQLIEEVRDMRKAK